MNSLQRTDIHHQLSNIYALITITDPAHLQCQFEDRIFDLVDELLGKYEDTDYPNLILDASPDTEVHKIGCLFDILLWSTRDEGARIQLCRNVWLEQSDERKIAVALCISNVYPTADFPKFVLQLKQIEADFPALTPLCAHWLSATQLMTQRDAAKKKAATWWYFFKTAVQKMVNRT